LGRPAQEEGGGPFLFEREIISLSLNPNGEIIQYSERNLRRLGRGRRSRVKIEKIFSS
jgi:hypothetical protein